MKIFDEEVNSLVPTKTKFSKDVLNMRYVL